MEQVNYYNFPGDTAKQKVIWFFADSDAKTHVGTAAEQDDGTWLANCFHHGSPYTNKTYNSEQEAREHVLAQ